MRVPADLFNILPHLPSQVAVKGDISNMRIHWQSTVHDLAELQQSMCVDMSLFLSHGCSEQLADGTGTHKQTSSDPSLRKGCFGCRPLSRSDQQASNRQRFAKWRTLVRIWRVPYPDFSQHFLPHACSEFDQKGFVSGVQLLTDNFGAILAGNGTLNGVSVANVCPLLGL